MIKELFEEALRESAEEFDAERLRTIGEESYRLSNSIKRDRPNDAVLLDTLLLKQGKTIQDAYREITLIGKSLHIDTETYLCNSLCYVGKKLLEEAQEWKADIEKKKGTHV